MFSPKAIIQEIIEKFATDRQNYIKHKLKCSCPLSFKCDDKKLIVTNPKFEACSCDETFNLKGLVEDICNRNAILTFKIQCSSDSSIIIERVKLKIKDLSPQKIYDIAFNELLFKLESDIILLIERWKGESYRINEKSIEDFLRYWTDDIIKKPFTTYLYYGMEISVCKIETYMAKIRDYVNEQQTKNQIETEIKNYASRKIKKIPKRDMFM